MRFLPQRLGNLVYPLAYKIGQSAADYLYNEFVRQDRDAVWELPGLAYLRPPASGVGDLFARARTHPHDFLHALEEAQRAGVGHTPTPRLVALVNRGGSFVRPESVMPIYWAWNHYTGQKPTAMDWPIEVKNAWDWVWGLSNHAGQPANLDNAVQRYAFAAGGTQSQQLVNEGAAANVAAKGADAIKATGAEVEQHIAALRNPAGIPGFNLEQRLRDFQEWLQDTGNKVLAGGVVVAAIIIAAKLRR